jgi:alpha-galactosidase
MRKVLLIFGIAISFLSTSGQKFESLAKTPPMGWNSWNKFGCNVSEELIMGMADAMVSSGMQDAGYEYVVIDDCWQVSRDENGNIVADKDKFPHGIKYLADYIHGKGLKFGIYSCAGSKTCAGRPGGRGHEFQDALMYSRWGVDYLKYDWCNTTTQDAKATYATMRDGLYTAGRPIVFSLCEWGVNKPWEWAGNTGHLWRTTGDISDSWNSMIGIVEQEKELAKYAGPGHWNDPDMLEVGNGRMTNEEYKTHFSMWCMLAAPLIAGNDLRNMTPETKAILQNKELIAVDQDSLGRQATCYRDNSDYQIWIKPLVNNEKAVCLLNKSDEKKSVLVDFALLSQVSSGRRGRGASNNPEGFNIRDLWEHKDLTLKETSIYIDLVPHSVKVYRFIKK